MTNNLLFDTDDILSPHDDFVLIYRDGTVLGVRGTRTFLKESPGQISAPFAESGLTVWTAVPPTPSEVEFCRLPDGSVHRIIHHEVTGALEQTCRFQLQMEPSAAFQTAIDFNHLDFSPLDFG